MTRRPQIYYGNSRKGSAHPYDVIDVVSVCMKQQEVEIAFALKADSVKAEIVVKK